MKVAVFPARGGSKRIPKKNIKSFCGKPIITWPIKAAKKSRLFDHILVSTDDHEIAKVAQSLDVEVPFFRPEEISDDHSGTTDVIAHATNWMLNQKWDITAVCCIYPTAVTVLPEDLIRGWEAIDSGNWSYAISVTEYSSNIFRSFTEESKGGIEMIFPEKYEMRSQDLPEVLHDAAQFYWGLPESWLKKIKIFEKKSFPVKIPLWRVQDIDTPRDWKRAELIFRILEKEKKVLKR